MEIDQVLGLLKGAGMGVMIVNLAIMVFMLVSWWIVFKKAGQPGWAILIPIFNLLVMLRVAGKPWWWIFFFVAAPLAIIPILGLIYVIFLLVMAILMLHGVSKNFGKGGGFTVGLILLSFVFVPILAFSKAEYKE